MRNNIRNSHRAALQPLLPRLRSRHSKTEPQAAHRRMATRPHRRRPVRLPTRWRPMPTPSRCLENHTRTAPMIERKKSKGPCIHSQTLKAQAVTVNFGACTGTWLLREIAMAARRMNELSDEPGRGGCSRASALREAGVVMAPSVQSISRGAQI